MIKTDDQKEPAVESAVGFFREGEAEYASTHYDDGAESYMSLRQAAGLEFIDGLNRPLERVLDAGCGPGHFARALADRDSQVWGIDTSPGMVTLARSRVPEGRFTVANVERTPFPDGFFDLVCSNGVIEYLESDRTVLDEFHRILKPGGTLLISVTNLWSPVGYLDFAVEAAKRNERALGWINRLQARRGQAPIRPRHFPVRKHRPARFRENVAQSRFRIDRDRYFAFWPVPHPLTRLLPGPSSAFARSSRGLDGTPLRWWGEGYLILATRPA